MGASRAHRAHIKQLPRLRITRTSRAHPSVAIYCAGVKLLSIACCNCAPCARRARIAARHVRAAAFQAEAMTCAHRARFARTPRLCGARAARIRSAPRRAQCFRRARTKGSTGREARRVRAMHASGARGGRGSRARASRKRHARLHPFSHAGRDCARRSHLAARTQSARRRCARIAQLHCGRMPNCGAATQLARRAKFARRRFGSTRHTNTAPRLGAASMRAPRASASV